MATVIIELSCDLSDPDALVSEETVSTGCYSDGWYWTHIGSTRGVVPRSVNGPFPDEEAALHHAYATLRKNICP